MTQFRKYSIIIGWIVFAIAMLTYGLTVESAASLWDCPEFIATSYKLEVGHPPGTPLFFLINRIGAMFAGSPENVGYAINMLSALESALCIAFLFWTIANMARKIYRKTAEQLTHSQVLTTMVAATIGALAYAFTDTFWFSAVEAEVYALSSLFTAVVVWAMFRWESVADNKESNRWLIFISYMMGLSIGAHILNLLAIPALVFIYYFRKFPARPYKRLWRPAAVGVALTGIFYSLTPTVVSIGAWVDRIFVNGFGAPINMGLTVFIILILAALAFGIRYTLKAKKEGWGIILTSVLMVVIGFSTYGVVLIRSSVNPSMNSNQPDNPYALLSFLNREQYGSRPLIWGQSYASTDAGLKYSDGYYVNDEGKYVQYSYVSEREYDQATTMFFPRMYSEGHAAQYKSWTGGKGRKVRNSYGEMVTVPTFGENLGFFFGYQMNHMYWRYFLWNFVGRQNDIQSDGPTTGNWLSGITFIDEMFFGPQEDLPSVLANNKGRNTYYFLPLILGLIGFFFSLKRDGRGFLIISLLFFMTGIAIILYLNQTPSQPRERDYAYAASFYAFCIWIGIGAMALCEKLRRNKVPAKAAVAVGFVLSASVPVVLAVQNWDDHDRSGRTVARDMGWNYLTSVAPKNAIFINYGDNDTFPVWYAQEVEEIRPDVRVMNASYISGDWYVDQMRLKSNESEPLPISLPKSKYKGKSSPTFVVSNMPHPAGKEWTAKEVMSVVNSDAAHTKFFTQAGDGYDIIPSKRIALPVNKENVLKSGIVKPEDMHLVEDTIYLQLKSDYLGIGDMVILDIIATNDWTRPIYFTSAAGAADFGLVGYTNNEAFSYLQQDGAAYRFVPIRHDIVKNNSTARIDTELLYDNLINKFEYGGLKDDVYVDGFVKNVFTTTQFRNTFAQLASELGAKGESERAVEVLDRAMEEMPTSALGYDDQLLSIINEYYVLGEYTTANRLCEEFIEEMIDEINYYSSFTSQAQKNALAQKLDDSTHNLYTLLSMAETYGQDDLMRKYSYLFGSGESVN